MKTLVIVESPAKAKTIGKYLKDGYVVKASVGHVRDLPKSNKDAVDIEGGFIPRYSVTPGKAPVIRELQQAAAKADAVLLATDPDREGEAIAWHVAELLRSHNKNIRRIVFYEITQEAVKEALAHPRDIDIHLKEAQEARRVLDRLVGYDLSGLIWKKVRYGLSAGRVQSPALRIVMEREREIRVFVPEDFFVLTAHTTHVTTPIDFECTEKPTDKEEALRIQAAGEAHKWVVVGVRETNAVRTPRPPFTTSTLQQTASTRFGFSPSRTMGAAQKLYEAGHITYMRTDATIISAAAQKQALAVISKQFGSRYVRARVYKTKSKSAQEAHEAIRPTNMNTARAGTTDDQQTLYGLIRARMLASQMADAQMLRTKITANIKEANDTIPDFSVSGARVTFDGWLAADPAARTEDTHVPKCAAGDPLVLHNIDIEERQTQPPHRYTEAGLIKELEKRGIGRPSTYASIMKTIADRGYVEKVGRTLMPTDVGDVVSSFLEQHFASYIADDFTSEMETELDEIASGTRSYKRTLHDFYQPFRKDVDAKEHIEKLTTLGPGPKEFSCPSCGDTMMIKLGRAGTFLSCSRFPECHGMRSIDGKERNDDTPIGVHPENGQEIFVCEGRYGPYVQLGPTPEKGTKSKEKPRRASIPDNVSPQEVTLEDAVRFLSLPRELGAHPDTGEPVQASTGRFGPFIVHAGDFRSLKAPDTPYDITFDRALEILKKPKQTRKGETIVRDIGIHPKTKKLIRLYQSKSGRYLKKGFKRIMLPEHDDGSTLTVTQAAALLQSR